MMQRLRVPMGVLTVSLLFVATACASDDDDSASDDTTSVAETSGDGTTAPASGGLISFGEGKTPQPYDDYLDAAFADITAFWTDTYGGLYGADFDPVAGIYALYPDRADLPPSCDGPVAYAEVEGNAFYTSCGDIIVYDDAALLPGLVDKLGAAAVAVVAAHEYGHAIQYRAGVYNLALPTVDTEQQADCFAGAWTAHVARGESDALQFGDEDVKAGIVAMIEVRDEPGSDVANDPNGHGTAFDRVGAFQEGFNKGAERCKGFIEEPNPRLDLVFTEDDIDTSGNMALDELAEAVPLSLDTSWVAVTEADAVEFTPPTLQVFATDGPYPSCDGRSDGDLKGHSVFCAESNTVQIDEEFAVDLYNQIGDLAFGYLVGTAYSDAVQAAYGVALEGEPRVLFDDCLTGAWLRDVFPVTDETGTHAVNEAQEIFLSAGDLDEVVQTAVILGDEASSTDVNGTAFEKIDSFRTGVLGGVAACVERIG